MSRKTYRLTPTAEGHLKKAVRETYQRWGIGQARKYSAELLAGFQYIADNYAQLRSPHRDELAEGTAFSLHLVAHRYVAFQAYDADTVMIVGIFHESMDIPNRLLELRALTRHELAALKHDIARTKTRQDE